jgi:hypothetical protein
MNVLKLCDNWAGSTRIMWHHGLFIYVNVFLLSECVAPEWRELLMRTALLRVS